MLRVELAPLHQLLDHRGAQVDGAHRAQRRPLLGEGRAQPRHHRDSILAADPVTRLSLHGRAPRVEDMPRGRRAHGEPPAGRDGHRSDDASCQGTAARPCETRSGGGRRAGGADPRGVPAASPRPAGTAARTRRRSAAPSDTRARSPARRAPCPVARWRPSSSAACRGTGFELRPCSLGSSAHPDSPMVASDAPVHLPLGPAAQARSGSGTSQTCVAPSASISIR